MGLFSGFEHCVRENEPLAHYTWFRLGGVAEYFAEPTSVEELAALVRRCRETETHLRLLGGGSNVLVRDEGVSGLVVLLSAAAFSEISADGNVIKAGGGAKLGHVISVAVREGLAGLEGLAGIPGTIGAALHTNISANGVDIGQFARSATVLTRNGEFLTHQREDMRFAYRQSSLDEIVILSAELEMEPADPVALTQRLQKLWIVKKSTQPISDQNAGRIFKDPIGAGAGEASLIEQAGLKGARMGEAEISERDANFIVANPSATSDDVMRLIDLIETQVHERLGVELATEIEIW